MTKITRDPTQRRFYGYEKCPSISLYPQYKYLSDEYIIVSSFASAILHEVTAALIACVFLNFHFS